jgi:serine/threonine-protein kinase
MTAAGMILGTAAYMSPEQAKGKPVDKRADVWAFGAVLYEMLTGRRAFGGEDLSDTLATVLKFDPDWNRLPADTPEPIRRLLKRCLVKDPTRRLRDCGSALLEIRDAQSGESASAPPPVTVTVARSGRSWLLLTAVAAIAAAAGAGAWALLTRTAPAPAPVTRRFAIALPDTQNLTANTGTVVSIAQDGRSLVYRAGRDNKSQLFRRGLEQFDAVPIPATEAAAEQFLSPDGAWILFNENGKLRRLPAQGGPAQTLATLPSGIRGRDWTRDGRLFLGSLTQGGSLIQLAATGGEPTVVFKAPDQKRAMFPQLLPDGTHLLFTLADAEVRARELHVLRLGSSESRTVLEDAAAGRVLPTGHLI